MSAEAPPLLNRAYRFNGRWKLGIRQHSAKIIKSGLILKEGKLREKEREGVNGRGREAKGRRRRGLKEGSERGQKMEE